MRLHRTDHGASASGCGAGGLHAARGRHRRDEDRPGGQLLRIRHCRRCSWPPMRGVPSTSRWATWRCFASRYGLRTVLSAGVAASVRLRWRNRCIDHRLKRLRRYDTDRDEDQQREQLGNKVRRSAGCRCQALHCWELLEGLYDPDEDVQKEPDEDSGDFVANPTPEAPSGIGPSTSAHLRTRNQMSPDEGQ
jgi:hypothetical protein